METFVAVTIAVETVVVNEDSRVSYNVQYYELGWELPLSESPFSPPLWGIPLM